ncbi:P-type ATPase [Streptomyces niger]|uniref:P-type ATPase n=1 Tax=Streptomyces niger TaxID=66373 RepID=UPI000DA61F06|nr:cation-transporting P-type ATPase [Streptomyces niger]
MMKAYARVRRDGREAEIPAERVVAGAIVLLPAGDEVPADGRPHSAGAIAEITTVRKCIGGGKPSGDWYPCAQRPTASLTIS